jgi:hypothetical protein
MAAPQGVGRLCCRPDDGWLFVLHDRHRPAAHAEGSAFPITTFEAGAIAAAGDLGTLLGALIFGSLVADEIVAAMYATPLDFNPHQHTPCHAGWRNHPDRRSRARIRKRLEPSVSVRCIGFSGPLAGKTPRFTNRWDFVFEVAKMWQKQHGRTTICPAPVWSAPKTARLCSAPGLCRASRKRTRQRPLARGALLANRSSIVPLVIDWEAQTLTR